MKKKIVAELEFEYQALLGEGPVWDERNGHLWWIDILAGYLMQYSPEAKENKVFELGEFIGAAALRKNEGLILAMQSGFYFFNEKSGWLKKIIDPEPRQPGNRFNDGKCDPSGRFWAGTMAHDQTKKKGCLYRLNPDLSTEKVLSGVTISNGLCWNRVSGIFYYIDTPEMEILSYQYNQETGEITGGHVVCAIEKTKGFPDGMTIDADGFLWVALYSGGKIIRVNPIDGSIDTEVIVPVPKPTSCTFGGKNLDQLYITTCRENMTEAELKRAPLSGSLFKVNVPFRGFNADRFID